MQNNLQNTNSTDTTGKDNYSNKNTGGDAILFNGMEFYDSAEDARKASDIDGSPFFGEASTETDVSLPTETENGDKPKDLIIPMDFYPPSTENSDEPEEGPTIPRNTDPLPTETITPSIPSTLPPHQLRFGKVVHEADTIVAGFTTNRDEKTAENHRIIHRAAVPLTPYETMQKLSTQLGLIVVGDNSVYVYNGKYYELTSVAGLDRAIVNSFRDVVEMAGLPKYVEDVSSFVLKEPNLNVKELPIAKNVVSFENGLLNLSTGALHPHSKEVFTLYKINANYLGNCSVQCPMFENFLKTITQDDPMLIQRIWEMIGYVLTPDTSAKAFFLLQGVQNSGKSVLSTIISKLFSKDAVVTLDIHSYGEKFSVSELFGKSLTLSPDLPAEPLDSKAVGKIKQITGNDTIAAPVRYKNNLQFKSTAKLLLATNHPLLLKMRDDAFFDRAITIPFKYSVPKREQHFTLVDDLLTERDAIVTTALRHYFHLVNNNYNFAGNYCPNQVVMNNITTENTNVSIFKFLHTYFEYDCDGVVFTSDAYMKYIEKNRHIFLNEFSQYFTQYAEELFGAQKTRKRKEGAVNATSCICGIKWKERRFF